MIFFMKIAHKRHFSRYIPLTTSTFFIRKQAVHLKLHSWSRNERKKIFVPRIQEGANTTKNQRQKPKLKIYSAVTKRHFFDKPEIFVIAPQRLESPTVSRKEDSFEKTIEF